MEKKLHRIPDQAVFGGVASGIVQNGTKAVTVYYPNTPEAKEKWAQVLHHADEGSSHFEGAEMAWVKSMWEQATQTGQDLPVPPETQRGSCGGTVAAETKRSIESFLSEHKAIKEALSGLTKKEQKPFALTSLLQALDDRNDCLVESSNEKLLVQKNEDGTFLVRRMGFNPETLTRDALAQGFSTRYPQGRITVFGDK